MYRVGLLLYDTECERTIVVQCTAVVVLLYTYLCGVYVCRTTAAVYQVSLKLELPFGSE